MQRDLLCRAVGAIVLTGLVAQPQAQLCEQKGPGCATIWESLLCAEDAFSSFVSLAIDPSISFHTVLDDPGSLNTVFIVPDSSLTAAGISLSSYPNLARSSQYTDAMVAKMTFQYMTVPGMYSNASDLIWLSQKNGGVLSSLSEGYSSAFSIQRDAAALSFQVDRKQIKVVGITASETGYQAFEATVLQARSACNGHIYVVDKPWMLVPMDYGVLNMVQDADNVTAIVEGDLADSDVFMYQPECYGNSSAFGGPNSLALFSNSVAEQSGDMEGIMQLLTQFLPAASPQGPLELFNTSFTLFLPVRVYGEPQTSVEASLDVQYMLQAMLPGALCRWQLAGTITSLLDAYSPGAALAFKSDQDGTLYVGSTASANAAPSVMYPVIGQVTVCKTVVYYYQAAAPMLPQNTSMVGILPTAAYLWDAVARLTGHYERTPAACPSPLLAPEGVRKGMPDATVPSMTMVLPAPAASLGIGVIVGLAVGGAVLLVLSFTGIIVWQRKDRRRSLFKRNSGDVETDSNRPPSSCTDVKDDSVDLGKSSGIGPDGSSRDASSELPLPPTPSAGYSPFMQVQLSMREQTSTSTKNGSLALSSVASEVQQALATAESWARESYWVDAQDVQRGKLVGSGSSGTVYSGWWRGTPVALKQLRVDGPPDEMTQLQQQVVNDLKKELSISAGLQHPHVLRFLGVVLESEQPLPTLIMEYAERGSLYNVIGAARGLADHSALPWQRRLSMALGAALGMEYLHSRNVLHADLKSPNLLVDKSWTVKVSDFGMSKVLEQDKSRTSVKDLNPIWLCPCRIASGQHSKASDVYSFGVILWELLCLMVPWQGVPVCTVIFWVVTLGKRPEIPEDISAQLGHAAGLNEYLSLMRDCWAHDPTQRPTFTQIVERLNSIRRMEIARLRSARLATSDMSSGSPS